MAGRLLSSFRLALLCLARLLRIIPLGARTLLSPILILTTRAVAVVPRILRFLFVSSRIGVTITPIVLIAAIATASIVNPYMKADLDYAHERSSAVEVLDRDGRWLGILPPANFSDWSDGSILPPDHSAIPLVQIPPIWRSCLVFLEDRDFDGISRWFGVDPLAVLKSGWQTITFQRRRGASTLYMQVVRTLHGRSPGQHEAPGEVLLRKVAELFGANALVRMLDSGDSDAPARFVGMHLPLIIGAGGSSFGEPVHGIELASRILFGAPSNALPPELQALLAAAVKAPIVMAPPGDTKGLSLANARWRRAKDRADYCLRNIKGEGADLAQARERLAKMELPKPALDSMLAKLLPNDAHAAWRIIVNPARRALFFARHELMELAPELNRVAGTNWRGRVVSIRLTTSAAENPTFDTAVVGTLRRLQASIPRLGLSLTNLDASQNTADVVIACADPEGRIRQIYSNRQGLFWNRSAPVGSIGKIPAAVALGTRDRPDTPYCPAPIPGIASSESGDPEVCRHREVWRTSKDAFAHSDNKAIHWALRRTDPKVLATVASELGLPSFRDTPPATAMTIGTFEMTPAEMLRLVGSVGAGIAGSGSAGPAVHLIESITTIDQDGQSTSETIHGEKAVPAPSIRRLFPPRVRSFVQTVLRSTSESGGTLQALDWLNQQLGGALYAKTGTVSVLGSTRNIHIAGSFVRDGRPWSFVVTVGSPASGHALGRRLSAGQFAPLAALAVCRPDTTQMARRN